MAETKYESQVCSIPNCAANVYKVLSNLENINRVKDLIPQDKVQEMEAGPDYLRIKVDGLGQKLTLRIVERKENDTIKFGLEGAPMQANFWIQLKELAPVDTRIKLTLKADIPFMFKMMLDKKLQQGLDQAAQMLTQFPYNQWL
ncbi:MAG: SRPBCC family protein [Bacteroidales bacterium]|nr:SRPBCC family protein [Bacteroidales bacterium]